MAEKTNRIDTLNKQLNHLQYANDQQILSRNDGSNEMQYIDMHGMTKAVCLKELNSKLSKL